MTQRPTAFPWNRALLCLCSLTGILSGACGSRTFLGEAPGEIPGETGGNRCTGAACMGELLWPASGAGFHLQVFNKPGIDASRSICGAANSNFAYVIVTRTLIDRSCYLNAVGAGSFTVEASTADAIVAQLQSMRLVNQSMCTTTTPTYAFEIVQDSGSSRTFQDCAPKALEVPPFVDVDDLAELDQLLTDAAQRARDAGR